jgi:hypothetical protein
MCCLNKSNVAAQGQPPGTATSSTTATSSSKKSTKKAAKSAKKHARKPAAAEPMPANREALPDKSRLLQKVAKNWAGMALGWGCIYEVLASAVLNNWKVLDWLEVGMRGCPEC